MAPTIAIPSSNYPEKHHHRILSNHHKLSSTKVVDGAEHVNEMEKMRKRNEELERELRESLKREDDLRLQLHKALYRLRVAEEAEELLCTQLGDLEVEAVEQARLFHSRLSSFTSHSASTSR